MTHPGVVRKYREYEEARRKRRRPTFSYLDLCLDDISIKAMCREILRKQRKQLTRRQQEFLSDLPELQSDRQKFVALKVIRSRGCHPQHRIMAARALEEIRSRC